MKKIFILLVITTLSISCQKSLQDKAAIECKEYTEKKCPTPVVNNTRVDSMVFENNNTIHYYYTFSGSADNVKAINLQKKQLRNMLRYALQAETGIKEYKDAGFIFRYTYRSKKHPNQVLLDEIFSYKDYKK